MIGVALGEDDAAQRPGAMGREQADVAVRIVHEAGVDQHIAVAGRHQIGVGDVLGHEDEVGDGHGIGLGVAGADQAGQGGFGFGFTHESAPSKPIITLADCGVAAISRPSSTRANGSLWLIRPSILSFSRGMAATTSGISVG